MSAARFVLRVVDAVVVALAVAVGVFVVAVIASYATGSSAASVITLQVGR